jgi:hypothetical protein
MTLSNDYRYERKFKISGLVESEVETLVKLHPAMFLEVYPPRYVNNLYFDTADLSNYFANLDGQWERSKVRIRWYGDLFGELREPALEVKFKIGLIGRKERYPLIPFSFGERICPVSISEIIGKSVISERLKLDLLLQRIALLNRYKRKYFQSADGKLRLTLDSELAFYDIALSRNTYPPKYKDRTSTVVELKYALDADRHARRVTNHFPLRMTKNSKYVQGIERTHL